LTGRESVPVALRAAAEFTRLCPDFAVCMTKSLYYRPFSAFRRPYLGCGGALRTTVEYELFKSFDGTGLIVSLTIPALSPYIRIYRRLDQESCTGRKGKRMNAVRKSSERGYADHGWLKSFHTFSFAGYYDPKHMGFGPLRVINEDRVAAGQGFGTHPHRDMEIISYVLGGELEHKDSMGTGSVIRPGDVQRMSAGTGVSHSEYNPSRQKPLHFLQIWIEPAVTGIEPSYEQKFFAPEEKRGKLRLVASPDGRDGSVLVHQDAKLYAALLDGDDKVSHKLADGRKAYVHVARGAVTVNGQPLGAGDALKASGESEILIENGEKAEVLLFDMA